MCGCSKKAPIISDSPWDGGCVCEEAGRGAAVLLRALEPTHGLDAMHARRGVSDARLLCAGPGRLTQALGVGLLQVADLPPDAASAAESHRA